MPFSQAAARVAAAGFRHGRALFDVEPDRRQDLATIIAAANDHDDPTPGLRALFAGIIEPWSDSFRPLARAAYGAVFAEVVWQTAATDEHLLTALRATGATTAADLETAWQTRRRAQQTWPDAPQHIAVLSRVTLGADILLVSTLLQHLQDRYPAATIHLLGAGKLHDLFGACPHLSLTPLTYARRGPLRERLHSWLTVRDAVADADLVISPDSRLDQLGLLPLGGPGTYHRLWENTLPDDAAIPLAARIDHWCSEQFNPGASHMPRLWPSPATCDVAARLRQATGQQPLLAVKFDVGGNPAKALPAEFEREFLRAAVNKGWRVIIDRGFGNAELAASDRLLAELGWQATDLSDDPAMGLPPAQWDAEALAAGDCLRLYGSIGTWAGAVMASHYAFAYDSVGQHLAAAAGTPVLVAFAGFADDRFPVAWQPLGPASITTLRFPPATLAELLAALPPAPPATQAKA